MNTYWKFRFEYWTIAQAKTPTSNDGNTCAFYLITISTLVVILNLLNASTPNIASFFESGTKFGLGGHIVFACEES